MFFQTLREIVTGEIDELLFKESKSELINDWRNSEFLFSGCDVGIIGINKNFIEKMKITDLHEAVFFVAVVNERWSLFAVMTIKSWRFI